MKALHPGTVNEFAAYFNDQALRTVRVVRTFEDGDLGMQPGPGSMTTAQQIQHLCAGFHFQASVLKDKTPDTKLFKVEYDVSTIDKCVENMLAGIQAVNDALAFAGAQWDDLIEPFGPAFREPRAVIASMLVDHDIHHRGQLTVYLRVAGKQPPGLFEPVEEKVFKTSDH